MVFLDAAVSFLAKNLTAFFDCCYFDILVHVDHVN